MNTWLLKLFCLGYFLLFSMSYVSSQEGKKEEENDPLTKQIEAMFSEARVEYEKKDYDKAIEILQSLIVKFQKQSQNINNGRNPTSIAYIYIAECYESKGDIDHAIEWYEKSIEQPSYYTALDLMDSGTHKNIAFTRLTSYYEKRKDLVKAYFCMRRWEPESWCGNCLASMEESRASKMESLLKTMENTPDLLTTLEEIMESVELVFGDCVKVKEVYRYVELALQAETYEPFRQRIDKEWEKLVVDIGKRDHIDEDTRKMVLDTIGISYVRAYLDMYEKAQAGKWNEILEISKPAGDKFAESDLSRGHLYRFDLDLKYSLALSEGNFSSELRKAFTRNGELVPERVRVESIGNAHFINFRYQNFTRELLIKRAKNALKVYEHFRGDYGKKISAEDYWENVTAHNRELFLLHLAPYLFRSAQGKKFLENYLKQDREIFPTHVLAIAVYVEDKDLDKIIANLSRDKMNPWGKFFAGISSIR